jgi:cytoskeleton protein RodZ
VTAADAEIAELPADPGARLRRQREIQGLSEQRVSEQLNLDAGIVAALESDDYAALGAPVFVRGHLKRYAALVGLAEDQVVGAYDRSRAQLAQPSLIPKARVEMAPVRERPRWPRFTGAALLSLAAAGAATYLLAYGLHLPGGGSAGRARSGLVLASRSATLPATAGVASGSSGEGAAAVPPGQVGLAFDFMADSWVEVYDGSGKAVLYDLGKAGTRRVVAGVAPLSVTLGNAPAVALAVNGRRVTVPPPPAGQTVTRFGVGSDGSAR